MWRNAPDSYTRYVDRGPLSRWALAQIGHINVVKYLPGPKNATADWLSRYQLLGRNEFSTSGFSKALGGLLRQLAQSCKQLRSVWIYASPAESDIQAQRQVQQWRTPTDALLKGAPVEHNVARDFDLAILAPASLKAPQLAHQLLKNDRAFAMLLPPDLLDCVALRNDGVVDDDALLRMRAVRTMTLGGSGLLRIIHGADASRACVSASKDNPVPTTNALTGPTAARMRAGQRFRCWMCTRRTPPATPTTRMTPAPAVGCPLPRKPPCDTRWRCRARRYAES